MKVMNLDIHFLIEGFSVNLRLISTLHWEKNVCVWSEILDIFKVLDYYVKLF